MEPYWENEFIKDIKNKNKHHLKLYKYTTTTIALVSTHEFNKGYGHELKRIGMYNTNLNKLGENTRGWLIKLKDQGKLNDLLKDIIEDKVDIDSECKTPLHNSNKEGFIFLTLMTEIKNMIKESERDFYEIKKKDITQNIYINSDKPREGDLVFKFECSKGKVEIYQKKN